MSEHETVHPPPDPPLDRDERRAQLLRHVVALIGQHGMDGMTMRQVSRATGLSTGTINYHFDNKRGLILAALESADGAPAGDADDPARPRTATEDLRRIFSTFVLDAPERRDWWRFWVECTAHAVRDADLAEFQRQRYERQMRDVEEAIVAGVRRGELRPDIDPVALAEPLLALAYGLVIAQLTSPDAATTRRASDAIEGSLRELTAR